MKIISRAFLSALLFTVTFSHASLASEWRYSGDTGPDHWGSLSAEYATCKQGKNQSPVDIKETHKSARRQLPLKFKYNKASNSLYFNDHGMVINFAAGSFSLNGHIYALQQLYFHSPSEHQINGKSSPLEAQFVNADKEGKIAVVSVLFRQGAENKNLENILDKAPEKKWKYSIQAFKELTAQQLLPRKKTYYRLNGSLTTPPCTEGVLWLVMQHKVTVSAAQIAHLKEILGAPNNRPLQPIGSRIITR